MKGIYKPTYYDPATDLAAATTDLGNTLEPLAKMHPKVIAMGAISGGRVCGVFVLTRDDAYSPVGEDRMRCWARMFGNMPDGLLAALTSRCKGQQERAAAEYLYASRRGVTAYRKFAIRQRARDFIGSSLYCGLAKLIIGVLL